MLNARSQHGFPGVLPPPPGVTPDVHFTQSRWNLITQITCIVGATLFIFLRCFAKYVIATDFFLDDCKFYHDQFVIFSRAYTSQGLQLGRGYAVTIRNLTCLLDPLTLDSGMLCHLLCAWCCLRTSGDRHSLMAHHSRSISSTLPCKFFHGSPDFDY
jgi:hypothetical protein